MTFQMLDYRATRLQNIRETKFPTNMFCGHPISKKLKNRNHLFQNSIKLLGTQKISEIDISFVVIFYIKRKCFNLK